MKWALIAKDENKDYVDICASLNARIKKFTDLSILSKCPYTITIYEIRSMEIGFNISFLQT